MSMRRAALLFVIPAKAGIQGCKSSLVALDPGFRRGDGSGGAELPPSEEAPGLDETPRPGHV